MVTDKQILELALIFLGLAVVGIIVGVSIYFAYLKPNFFYGDYVALSLEDASGKTWWVYNDAKRVAFTTDQSKAAVLQFMPGTSTQVGQLFEGTKTSFELKHPHYNAFLSATCQSVTTDVVPGFSTTVGSQVGLTSDPTQIAVKGPAIVDGGAYVLTILGTDCVLPNCNETRCDASGCTFTVVPSQESSSEPLETVVECAKTTTPPRKWTFTKVRNLALYKEYQKTTQASFS